MNLRFDKMDKPKMVAAIAVTAAVLAVSRNAVPSGRSGASKAPLDAVSQGQGREPALPVE